jgi:16S rRNA (cytosine1402-N4)-methyltransferase
MFINQELADIEKAVASAVELLKVGGRLVVITFHSLEDRLVKTCLKHFAKADLLPIHIPVKAIDIKQPILTLLGKRQATAEEVQDNPRARSAMMRIAQKNDET